MNRNQSDVNLEIDRFIIPLFEASNAMPLQIRNGLSSLRQMLDNIKQSQTKTSLDFNVYCENEIAPCCIELHTCFKNVTSCAEKMKEDYTKKTEMLAYQKSQVGEKLRSITSEQNLNETKILHCEEQINEANTAKQISLDNIEDANKIIRRLKAEIEEANSRQFVAGGVVGVATIAGLFYPLTIPVVLVSVSGALVGLFGLEKKKIHFADLKHQEEVNHDKLEAKVKMKVMELESIKKERENLQQKMCEQKQIIEDLNNEISTLKLQMNITFDVLQIARNVCRSVNSVSVAVNVLKLETTNAYALEPLMIPLMELSTNLHQLFTSFPKSYREELESTIVQIEDRQKMIKAIKFNESTESLV